MPVATKTSSYVAISSQLFRQRMPVTLEMNFNYYRSSATWKDVQGCSGNAEEAPADS
jgi:hypothetical protein